MTFLSFAIGAAIGTLGGFGIGCRMARRERRDEPYRDPCQIELDDIIALASYAEYRGKRDHLRDLSINRPPGAA